MIFLKKILGLCKNILSTLCYILYLIIGLANIVVLVHAIAIKFHIGLFLALIISIFIGYIPVLGSALTVWGGCVWLGLNVLQSIFYFIGIPIILLVICGSAISDDN